MNNVLDEALHSCLKICQQFYIYPVRFALQDFLFYGNKTKEELNAQENLIDSDGIFGRPEDFRNLATILQERIALGLEVGERIVFRKLQASDSDDGIELVVKDDDFDPAEGDPTLWGE